VPARTRGFYLITDGEGRTKEIPTFTCPHCTRVVPQTERLPNGDEAKGFCHHCMKPVCIRCGAKQTCDPFEKKLERVEARAAFLRSVGLA
jgi:hypothetical protein